VTSIARELGAAPAAIPDLAEVTAAVEAGFAMHLSHPEPFRDRTGPGA
jgi:hypothetical protein